MTAFSASQVEAARAEASSREAQLDDARDEIAELKQKLRDTEVDNSGARAPAETDKGD